MGEMCFRLERKVWGVLPPGLGLLLTQLRTPVVQYFFGGMEGWIHGRLARLDDYLLIRRSACGGHLGF